MSAINPTAAPMASRTPPVELHTGPARAHSALHSRQAHVPAYDSGPDRSMLGWPQADQCPEEVMPGHRIEDPSFVLDRQIHNVVLLHEFEGVRQRCGSLDDHRVLRHDVLGVEPLQIFPGLDGVEPVDLADEPDNLPSTIDNRRPCRVVRQQFDGDRHRILADSNQREIGSVDLTDGFESFSWNTRNTHRRSPFVLIWLGALARASWTRVSGVNPIDLFRRLSGFEIQIDDDRLLTAPDHHAAENLSRARIDLLMGNERGNVNEIARASLGDKLQVLTPSNAPPAANHIENAFQFSMVVSTRFGSGLDGDRAHPQLVRACPGMGDRGGSGHAGRLSRIEVELRPGNDRDAMFAPIWLSLSRHRTLPVRPCRWCSGIGCLVGKDRACQHRANEPDRTEHHRPSCPVPIGYVSFHKLHSRFPEFTLVGASIYCTGRVSPEPSGPMA